MLNLKSMMNNEKNKKGSSFTNEKIKEYSVSSLINIKDMINNNEKIRWNNVKENKVKIQ